MNDREAMTKAEILAGFQSFVSNYTYSGQHNADFLMIDTFMGTLEWLEREHIIQIDSWPSREQFEDVVSGKGF